METFFLLGRCSSASRLPKFFGSNGFLQYGFRSLPSLHKASPNYEDTSTPYLSIQRRFIRRLPRVTVDLPWTPKVDWKPPPRGIGIHYVQKTTGDLETFDPDEYAKQLKARGEAISPVLKRSTLLEKADPITRDLLSADYLRRKELQEIYREELIRKVQRHPLDYFSLPAKIADYTAHIRWLQYLILNPGISVDDAPLDEKFKVVQDDYIFRPGMRFSAFHRSGLKKANDARREALARLRETDYKLFEHVLETLKIVYRPEPVFEHKIRRKECLRRLASEYVLLLKKERRVAYAKELEEQQEPFLEEKVKTLEWIASEEKDLMLPPTVTDEVIAAAKRQLVEYRERHAKQWEKEAEREAEFARSHGTEEGEEGVEKVVAAAAASQAAAPQHHHVRRRVRPEDVLAPSRFPVGFWPYDTYQMDEDVLVREKVHVEFKGFQEMEVLDERMYDEIMPKEDEKREEGSVGGRK